MLAARGILARMNTHVCIYMYVYVRIYIYTCIHGRTTTHVGGKNGYTRAYTHTHTYEKKTYTRHTLHGWPTNLRFYSSSQLFGWLNCYKGTLLRSTVFARYILVHFVYGLWLTRLIRFAMFFLVAWPYPQCSNRRRTETDRCTLRGGGGDEGSRKRGKKGRKKFVFRVFFPPSTRFIARRTDLHGGTKANSSIPTFPDSRE